MLRIEAEELETGAVFTALVRLSDLTWRRLPKPPGVRGAPTWGMAVRLDGPEWATEKLQAVVLLSGKDWDKDGTLELDELLLQVLVGNWEWTSPGDAGDFKVSLTKVSHDGEPLELLDVATFRSHRGAPFVFQVGKLRYDPGLGFEKRVVNAFGERYHELSDPNAELAQHIADAGVSEALADTHTSGGTDLTIGLLPAHACLVAQPAHRERILGELQKRRDAEARRPGHFILIDELGGFRPYLAGVDGGDLWEGNPSTKRVKTGDPYGWEKIADINELGGGDPEHFTRMTDELWVLAKATGDPVSCLLLHAPLQMIQSAGWPSWGEGVLKTPHFARMWGWVLRGMVQGCDVHGTIYIPQIEKQRKLAMDSLGSAFGVPYLIASKALGDHAPPTLEELRWYWESYKFGPKRTWHPAWNDYPGTPWELLNEGPLRVALMEAGALDLGSKWAYFQSEYVAQPSWDKPELAVKHPNLDRRVWGIGVLEVFAHMVVWQHAICLNAGLDAVEESELRTGTLAKSWRDLCKHLVWCVTVGFTGAGKVPAPTAADSVTCHRDLQLQGTGFGKEPEPYETLDSYAAETLARALRVLGLGGESADAARAGVEKVMAGAVGLKPGKGARVPNDFAEAMRYAPEAV